MSSPGEAPAGDRPVGADDTRSSTRTRIVDTALRLFEERGFERTTMRAIAAEAGLSLGSAYYYFPSKEHLVQGFYDRMQAAHHRASADVLSATTDATGRLTAVADAWLDVAEPYHEFAGAFFRVASQPTSPLSPFSPESGPAREAATDLWRRAVAGSDLSVDPQLQERLPELLWTAHMGLVLFWVHDRSPGRRKSRELVRRAVPLLVRVLRLSRLRPVRGIVREVTDLLDTISPGGAGGSTPG